MSENAASEVQVSARLEPMDAFLRRWRSWIAVAMCGYAFLRILVFCAAFPLFNPLDEQDHLETVRNYAYGVVPGRELPLTDPEMARVFALYGSPEYLVSRQRLHAMGMDVPVPELPAQIREAQFEKRFNYWVTQPVSEAQSPPLYYLIAAVWYKTGAAVGMKDWGLAYWVRFLNAIVYGVLVWVAFLFVKQVYPGRSFLCVAVPALLAVFPQDVFFGANRDILSPLLVALVLLLLFRAMREGDDSRFSLLAGAFLTGMAFLTDLANFVLFGVLAAAVYVTARKATTGKSRRNAWATTAIVGAVAVFPPLLRMARNRMVMGDLTGSKAKVTYLGWTVKPWTELWQHPIFTWHGAGYFLQEVGQKYWRGELVWQGIPMRGSVADGFYLISSCLLVAAFAVHLRRTDKTEVGLARLNGWLSLYLLLASVMFLAAISLPFDFHECFYPSRALPYFLSGRIICGTLLPFAVIYANGFEYLWRPVRRYVHPVIPFAVLCVCITGAEISIRSDVFHSAFNFFSLLGK